MFEPCRCDVGTKPIWGVRSTSLTGNSAKDLARALNGGLSAQAKRMARSQSRNLRDTLAWVHTELTLLDQTMAHYKLRQICDYIKEVVNDAPTD